MDAVDACFYMFLSVSFSYKISGNSIMQNASHKSPLFFTVSAVVAPIDIKCKERLQHALDSTDQKGMASRDLAMIPSWP